MGKKIIEEDREAERRFNETLGRLVNTPPKPHVKNPETEPAKEKDKGGDQR